MKCLKCSYRNKEGALFCAECGNKLTKNMHSQIQSKTFFKKWVWGVVVILLVALILVIVWEEKQKFSIIQEKRQLSTEMDRIKEADLLKDSEITDLQNRANMLQTEASTSQSQARDALQTSADTEAKVEELRAEFEEIKSNVYSLESWTSSNAFLTSNTYSIITNMCKTSYKKSNNQCIIDANLMGKKMSSCIGFKWTDDKSTSNQNSADVLYDTSTFFASKKGDCDDFSFFYSAWIRSEYEQAKSSCSEKDILVKINDNGSALVCPCAFYTICGSLNVGGGHCEVAITSLDNSPYSVRSFLANVYIIEPQNGGYSGKTEDVFNNVWEVISNDDYITVNDNQVSSSIQQALNKINTLSI